LNAEQGRDAIRLHRSAQAGPNPSLDDLPPREPAEINETASPLLTGLADLLSTRIDSAAAKAGP
jgi:hypothetical protein